MIKRKSKEDKVLEHSNKVINTLLPKYPKDCQLAREYKDLHKDFFRLARRMGKTIKHSDNSSQMIIEDHKQMEGKFIKTAKNAKAKILKEFEVKSDLINEINNLNSQIVDLNKIIAKKEQEINLLKVMNSKKSETSTNYIEEKSSLTSDKINLPQYKDASFLKIMTDYIFKADRHKSKFVVMKVTIDGYDDIRKKIRKSGREETFLKGILRYLKSVVSTDDLVYYSSYNIFYYVFSDIKIKAASKKVESLNKKREVSGMKISFSIGATEFKKGDSVKDIQTRCNLANDEAALETKNGSFISHI